MRPSSLGLCTLGLCTLGLIAASLFTPRAASGSRSDQNRIVANLPTVWKPTAR